MSHTPGTENGATALQGRFKEESNQLLKLLRFANDLRATSLDNTDLDDVEDSDDLDGVMRYVD